MGLEGEAAEGEAETGAAAASAVELHERHEDELARVGGDGRTVVGDEDAHRVVADDGGGAGESARVADGVADDGRPHALEEAAIGVDPPRPPRPPNPRAPRAPHPPPARGGPGQTTPGS